jgi:hypothetical protein
VVYIPVKSGRVKIPNINPCSRTEGSKYRHDSHQWLEEHIGPLDAMGGDQPFTLDLHLPIRE